MNDEHVSLDKTQRAINWLSQFHEDDQPFASLLLKKIQWVSAYDFETSISDHIKLIDESLEGATALFVEREVLLGEMVYTSSESKPRRAKGCSFEPIKSIDSNHEVGSEGILNTIATSISRSNSQKYHHFPSAEKIRERKIRKIIIMTDTIGTGSQLYSYLSCFWRVPSIRSWVSSGFIKFYVVCYAASESGVDYAQSHPTRPDVIYSRICPTIQNSFPREEQAKIYEICKKYNPVKNGGQIGALGYGGISALILYSHGLPNNAPSILYKRSSKWTPLFRGRTSIDVKAYLPTGFAKVDDSEYLKIMGEKRLSISRKLGDLDDYARKVVLLLASLNRSPRSKIAIASRTGLSLITVSNILVKLTYLEWIDAHYRITDEGHFLLDYLRKEKKNFPQKALPEKIEIDYYPGTLRGL
ncbi:TPA: phosphoribosyltransferase-like protein [Serratia fonticola]